MKLVTLLAASSLSLASLASLGCSSSDPPSDAFPVGPYYTRCAGGTHVPGSAPPFLNSIGFLSGPASFTLEQSGSVLPARYYDENGKESLFDFAVTTSTSATLASKGETVPGFTGFCSLRSGGRRDPTRRSWRLPRAR